MTESKDFRAGTRLLRWEKDKLTMELKDLQAKWTEIQQTKVQNTVSVRDLQFVIAAVHFAAVQGKQTGASVQERHRAANHGGVRLSRRNLQGLG